MVNDLMSSPAIHRVHFGTAMCLCGVHVCVLMWSAPHARSSIDPFAGLHSCMYPLKMHALNITDFVQAFFPASMCNEHCWNVMYNPLYNYTDVSRMHMWKNEMGISTENFVVLWLNKITISIIANSFTSVCFYNYIVGFEKAFIQTHFDLFFLAV
jgi:hypothetical protein